VANLMSAPELVLHLLPPSPPCLAVEVALRHKGLEYERVALTPGQHVEDMQRIYGEGSCLPGRLGAGQVGLRGCPRQALRRA
jgi:hypothetical protein